MKWSITIHRHINTHFFYLIKILLSFAKQLARKQDMNVAPSHDNKFIDLKIIIFDLLQGSHVDCYMLYHCHHGKAY